MATSGSTADLHRSPLHTHHQELGAKTAAFGGWEMPLEYATGILAEHKAVRTAAGIFDVSHLGKVVVRGAGAAEFVNASLTNDLAKIGPGQAQYTLCCDDASGGIIDDLIVYLVGDDELLLVPNAANAAEVVRRLQAAAPAGVEVIDEHHDHAVLAVQGPASDSVLIDAGLPTGHDYMSFARAVVTIAGTGVEVIVCRTGYTGERGYELMVASGFAGALWESLIAAGTAHGLVPCGLGARDTLRTEMGYPLHGQDIGLDVTPVQGRLGWAVGWRKPAFWGREVLTAEKERGAERILRGIRSVGRGIPRPGMEVRDGTGDVVGAVTSGTFAPSLRTGVGLALLAATVSEGEEVSVDVRGRTEGFIVQRPPFVETAPR